MTQDWALLQEWPRCFRFKIPVPQLLREPGPLLLYMTKCLKHTVRSHIQEANIRIQLCYTYSPKELSVILILGLMESMFSSFCCLSLNEDMIDLPLIEHSLSTVFVTPIQEAIVSNTRHTLLRA